MSDLGDLASSVEQAEQGVSEHDKILDKLVPRVEEVETKADSSLAYWKVQFDLNANLIDGGKDILLLVKSLREAINGLLSVADAQQRQLDLLHQMIKLQREKGGTQDETSDNVTNVG